jgi:hypothetical protein
MLACISLSIIADNAVEPVAVKQFELCAYGSQIGKRHPSAKEFSHQPQVKGDAEQCMEIGWCTLNECSQGG